MDVRESLEKRRAYRSLSPVEITEPLIYELASAASLMPSCFNKQPWRYVFVYKDPYLSRMKEEVLAEGNAWAKNSSLIIAVVSKKDLDCIIKEREYFLFDTGMATGAILLRATEMGLVAHPIAGYDPVKAKSVLGIPEEYIVVTLVNVGKKNPDIDPILSDWQKEAETTRPERLSQDKFAFRNKWVS